MYALRTVLITLNFIVEELIFAKINAQLNVSLTVFLNNKQCNTKAT